MSNDSGPNAIVTAHTLPLQLCPQRPRIAEPTPLPIEFRHGGFRAWTEDGCRRGSVRRPFSTRKCRPILTTRRRLKTRSPSSSWLGSSACRGTAMVSMDHSSARPGDDRAHGRVRCIRLPGDFTAGAGRSRDISSWFGDVGTRTWAPRRERGGGGGAGRGCRNAGAWQRED